MTKKVLLSVRPKWAYEILDGSKKFEYRKQTPNLDPPYTLLLYATSPASEIVGKAVAERELTYEIPKIIAETIDDVPHTPVDIHEYFGDRKDGNALEIAKPERFDMPLELQDVGVEHAPQNFCYVETPSIQGASQSVLDWEGVL